LQTSSGVGPKLAQAVLAVHAPRAVRLAIATKDITALTAVPGIGRKGAERLVLELRDKIGAVGAGSDIAGQPGAVAPVAPWRDQVGHALVGLGWSAKEADAAVTEIGPEAEAGADVPALLKSALRLLGRS
jgi:Holliday junction DNA helicase RuvA